MVQIMGILNITPDSFSDGNQFNRPATALRQAQKLINQGCKIIDIGAQASNPNAADITAEEELRRLKPILITLKNSGIFEKAQISIDTTSAKVASYALNFGAHIINDISGLTEDPQMAATIAYHNAKIILMYKNTPGKICQKIAKNYDNIIQTISNFLEEQANFAIQEGIKSENIIIDPGMGAFLSTISEYSYQVIHQLEKFQQLNYPILLGTSRKSFLQEKEVEAKDTASQLMDALAIYKGANIIRTHNPENHQLLIKHIEALKNSPNYQPEI